MTTVDQAGTVDSDDVIPDYIAQRTFKFGGKTLHRGDPITVAIYRHRRFDALISTGYIKAVIR